jgi:outer membrane biogenesis lipoprotein LolB
MNKFSLVTLLSASLLSACASKPSHSQTKTASSDCCASEKTPSQAQRDYAAKTAASVPSAPSSVKQSKAHTHVTDSTQVETVLGTKPVIGDDSELRR